MKVIVPLFLLLTLLGVGQLHAADFKRGDVNEDGTFDLAVGITMLQYMFSGGVGYCEDAYDYDDDGVVNLADAISGFTYLFLNGSAPAEPFNECGPDPIADNLGCESYAECSLGGALQGLDQATFDSFLRGRDLMHKKFTPEEGLGPYYNAVSCVACHSTPEVGGSSPIYRNFFFAAVGAPGSQGPIWDPDDLPSIVMPSYTVPGAGSGGRPSIPESSQVADFRSRWRREMLLRSSVWVSSS